MSVARASARTVSGAGPSDAALVLEARGGERWAFEALFRRHGPRLNGIAFRVMGRDDEIDDLVQDTFVSAFETLERLEDPNAFASWIGSILVRQALKKIRRRRMLARFGLGRAVSPLEPDALVSASAPPDKVALLRTIYAALEALPAEQRIALILHRVEGFGLDETARTMGLSVATVKRRIVEADAQLRPHAER